MRIRLNLIVVGNRQVLPINYQYEFSAWIYKVLYQSDKAFAGWLHEQGYEYGKKRFKLFTFSQLKVKKYKFFKDRFKILSGEAELIVSFHIEEAVQHFITGLFQNRTFTIGDKKSRVSFEVQTVETLPEPAFEREMRFKALSPICVSKPVDRNGKLIAKYLVPGDADFELYFIKNLLNRYKAFHETTPNLDGMTIRIKGKTKSRLIKIKADTPQQTQIRGSLFKFTFIGPVELQRLGYEAGFGEKGSLGFGCVGVR